MTKSEDEKAYSDHEYERKIFNFLEKASGVGSYPNN